MIRLGVISVLPEMFVALQYGVCGRAIQQGLAQVSVFNPRDFATRSSRHVDDKPYGGGPGMVMMYEPLRGALTEAKAQVGEKTRVIYLSPQGSRVQQHSLTAIAKEQQSLVFVAGRYEGIDERFIEHYVDEEWSLGDFILSGGELAAMVYIDAILRLLPGSLGNPGSIVEDSFMQGMLEHPHYTRPEVIHGTKVPKVLMSGNHQEIQSWRRQQALGRTWLKRPELLDTLNLNEADSQLLAEFIEENAESA